MKPYLLLVILAAELSACRSADDKPIGLGQPIRHDDFLYSVRRVETPDRIGTLHSTGRFWVVTFVVQNEARRVSHAWTNATAYVTDEHGRTYENQPSAQQQLNRAQPFGWRNQYVTPAGRTDSTRLVFDLPASVRRPYARVRGDVLMGDVFDGGQFETSKIRLF